MPDCTNCKAVANGRTDRHTDGMIAFSCADDFDPDALPLDVARQRILAALQPLPGRQCVALREALNRVLADDLRAPFDVPGHTHAVMDGYALRAEDLPDGAARTLRVIGKVFAGGRFSGRVGANECVRIMTGAPLPTGADAVVMQERCEPLQDDQVRIDARHDSGRHLNIRRAGAAIRRGQTALAAGRRLTAADLGVIASLGLGEVRVRRRPRVAFFSTGDELQAVGGPPLPGQVYDSNRYTLYGMIRRLHCEAADLGVVDDHPGRLREALRDAAAQADVVITSGGVSVGEADYTREALHEIGSVAFWKIAMKPGRPLTFGRLGAAPRAAWFFGLPGNPVSVMVTFRQLVQPALQTLSGLTAQAPLTLTATLTTTLNKRPGRIEFQRGVLEQDAAGALTVRSTGDQGSGILTSMSQANCLIVLAQDAAGAPAGSSVDVQPFCDVI